MPTFRVGVLEVWQRNVIIDADDRNDAVEKVIGGADAAQESHSHVRYVPEDQWPVENTEAEELFLESLATIEELKSALLSVGVPETSSFFYRADALSKRMAAAYEQAVGAYPSAAE